VKVGGENVAASKIEQMVGDLAGVYETAPVAQKHPNFDEVLVFVRAARGIAASARPELGRHIIAASSRAKRADFKGPGVHR
jgi:carnitine-CoA ligase